ncbi:hypothetical protein MMC30_007553 [Trapelia coarctata]|nr:hypothetical protein [Trapelia coarctata]
MSAPSPYLLLEPPSLVSFLTFILKPRTSPSTLIICSTRDQFLRDLLSSCYLPPPSPSPSQPSSPNPPPSKHPLLHPTIHLLATSRNIHLAFTPTLPHLRAHLAASSPPPSTPRHPPSQPSNPSTLPPIMAILNPLPLHRSAGEMSAQGLSRTLALAVEAATRVEMQLVVCETAIRGDVEVGEGGEGGEGGNAGEGDVGRGMGDAGEGDTENGARRVGRNPWSEQIPLLSGSLRFGGEQRVWAGRTVEARLVAGRWFRCVVIEEGDGDGVGRD